MRKNDVFEVRTENLLRMCEIKDSGYKEKFWHEDFDFIILFYLFIYLFIFE